MPCEPSYSASAIEWSTHTGTHPVVRVAPLTDAQWEQIRLLLPRYVSQTRQHVSDPRRIIEGIVWVIQTNSSWRGVPACFGPWSNVAEHYYRWRKAGKWARILQILQEQAVPISSSA
ncbi:MAG TPA: transposase [Ktedonobacterales bacterium]|nr:transposase [Ktedonobacterales bacterium]